MKYPLFLLLRFSDVIISFFSSDFLFSRIFSFSIGYIYPVLIDAFTLFLNLQSTSFLFRTCTLYFFIPFLQLKLSEWNSMTITKSTTSLMPAGEDLDVYAEKLNSMNESNIADDSFTSITLKERTPVSVFRTF